MVFFPLRGRALVEVVREACLLALVEVLSPGLMFGGRSAGIVPFSVVDDDACEIVSFASVASKPFPSRLFPGLEFVDYTVEKTGEGQFGRFLVGRRWRRSGALAVGGVGVPAQNFKQGRGLLGVFE